MRELLIVKLRRLKWYGMFMATSSLVFMALVFTGDTIVHAGAKTKCEKPACGMKMCQAMKNGKPNGSNCSNRCSKSCCFCKATCPRDEYRGDPEEGSQ